MLSPYYVRSFFPSLNHSVPIPSPSTITITTVLLLLRKDDAGLSDFYNDHYTYPLYRDMNLDFYNSFGLKGKITDHISWSTILNPFKAYKQMQKMNERMTSKNLKGNLIGEGLKTGGIIIFGLDGQPKYAYPEITGQELNVNDLLIAIKSVRQNNSHSNDGDSGDGNDNDNNANGDKTNEL
jgi:hypothetical protein